MEKMYDARIIIIGEMRFCINYLYIYGFMPVTIEYFDFLEQHFQEYFCLHSAAVTDSTFFVNNVPSTLFLELGAS